MLEELARTKPDKKKLKKLYSKYRQPDIQKALSLMFKGLCCYCETPVRPVAPEHIEHRRPKRSFPEQTFDWDNLHLACPTCNTHKGKKWDESASILCSCTDDPTKHLSYEPVGMGISRWPISTRGQTTVNHAHLNREDLRVHRLTAWLQAERTILAIGREMRRSPPDPAIDEWVHEVRSLTKGKYGSMIQFLLETHGI